MKCPFVIKVCTKCGEILVANSMNFGKMKRGKYGLKAECKKCKNQCNKEYYENNKEEIKEYKKEYYENNKEEIKDKCKEYRENNKEKLKEYYENNKEEIKEYKKEYYENNKERLRKEKREYYENNKDKLKEYRKEYYENNKDKLKEYRKEYYENNKEEIKDKRKEYCENNPHITFNNNNKRRQKEESQGDGLSKEQWLEMMKFFDFRCAYSGEYIGGNSEFRTVDHIISLNNGGENEIWNCVPMYKSYNSSKYTNDMLEWYKQQEFFNIDRLRKIFEWRDYAFRKWGNQ